MLRLEGCHDKSLSDKIPAGVFQDDEDGILSSRVPACRGVAIHPCFVPSLTSHGLSRRCAAFHEQQCDAVKIKRTGTRPVPTVGNGMGCLDIHVHCPCAVSHRMRAAFHEQQCDAVNNQEDGHKTRPYSREWYGLSGYSCSLSVCGILPDTGGSQ